MKKIHILFIVVISLTVAFSCSKFEQLNTNPNAATSVSPEMLATQLMKNAYRFWNPNSADFASGNLWCKHTAILNSANPYQYNYSFWPYGGFGGTQAFPTLAEMETFAKGNPAEASFQGLALFFRGAGGGATFEMGDIPYSEAGKAKEGITRPKYDKQADIIVAMLDYYKAAEEKFALGKNFGSCDIMYNGDASKWRKLCNFGQLKLIQTISKKATAEQKARFAAIVAANNLFTSNADNFQLVYSDNTNASHPYYGGEGMRLNNGVSKLMVDELKKVKDRRLFYFAEPAKYLITAGKLETDFDAYEGAPTELAYDKLAVNNAAGKYSLINIRYTLLKAGDPSLKASYAEQCFILAEAVEEGWITGDAKTYYEDGVKAQLTYYMNLPSAQSGYHNMKITQAYIDGYFTDEAAYKTGGTKEDRLHQIWTQRWFLDFFTGNLNYYNYLRTGWPLFPLDPATSMNPEDKTKVPQRWKYPTSELTQNPDNYKKAIDEQFGGNDGINEKTWWLK
jgi:hypothetical protein